MLGYKLNIRWISSISREPDRFPDQLKKPRAGSDGDRSARPDRCEPEGHWKDIMRRNIFGSQCRSSFMSNEVRVSTFVSPLWTCIKVLSEHILCTMHIERIIIFEYTCSIFCSLYLSRVHYFLF